MESVEPERQFYQGILQIAVACYHLENLNGRGATILLGEGIRRLADYQNDYPELNVTQLIEESQRLLVRLQHTEPEAIAVLLREIQASDDSTHLTDEQSLKFPEIVKIQEEV